MTSKPVQRAQLSLEERWSRLRQHRLDWAMRARTEFLESLESEAAFQTVQEVQTTEHREVVVLGEAQVGKTTLILSMHGVVDEEAEDRLMHVLDGGRTAGNSSTATAAVFGISPEPIFRIQRPSDEEPVSLSDEQARERLRHIRTRMEEGELSDRYTLRVDLPRDAVRNPPAEKAPLDIIDLPGLDPTNPAEREHARKLAELHLPRANLTLLVGKAGTAHQISFLQGGSNLLGRTWMHQTGRFALVETHALSDNSTRNQVLDPQEGPDTREEFIDHYRSNLIEEWTGDQKVPDEEIEALRTLQLYPLELGPIPQTPNDQQGKQRRRVKKWQKTLRQSLIDRVRKAVDSPLGDLRFLVTAYNGVKKYAEHLEQKTKATLRRLEKKHRKKRRLLRQAELQEEDLRRQTMRLKERVESIPDLDSMPGYEKNVPTYNSGPKTVTQVVRYINTRMAKQINDAEKFEEALRKLLNQFDDGLADAAKKKIAVIDRVTESVNDISQKIVSKMRGRKVFERIGPWKQKRVREWQHKVARKMSTKKKLILQKAYRKTVEKIGCNAVSEGQSMERKIRNQERIKTKVERDLKQIEERKERVGERLKRMKRAKEDDVKRWRNLKTRFEEAYDAEVERQIKEASRGGDAAQILCIADLHKKQQLLQSLKEANV